LIQELILEVINEMKTFAELGLDREILDILNELGFEKPSEIQEGAIPIVLAGRDIIGGSATGSGKTLAFSSSIIQYLKPNKHVQALILTPTRELAEQVAKSIKIFSKNKNLNVLAVYGGADINAQIRNIFKTDILVGTPGRILDHLQRGTLKLNEVKFLVLDEVDRMFDMGFHRDVEKIISRCPQKRQTMLFSATISSEIDHLAKKYTKNPLEISVEAYVDDSKLEQIYYDIDGKMKFSLLAHLLKKEDSELVMVFCSTRRNADIITENLNLSGIHAQAIHGGLVQNKRLRILKEFHEKNIRVLVCTDVAARGLDIKEVSHVYNYDLPKTSDDYIHRIGRTARAGEKGKAISILCNRDYENFSNILRDEKLKIEKKETPEIEFVQIKTYDSRKRNFGKKWEMEKPKRNFGKSRERNNFSRRDNKPRNFRQGNNFGRSQGNRFGNSQRENSNKPRNNFGNKRGGNNFSRNNFRGNKRRF